MSDQQTNTDTQTDDAADGPKALRDALSRRDEDLKAERERSRRLAFKMAGFDPDKGMGKAVWNSYDGESDPDAIVAHAKDEYDWEATADQTQEQSTQQTPQQQAQVPAAQQRMQTVADASVAENALNLDQQIEQAQRDGDWERSGRLKDQRLAERLTAR